MTPAIAPDPARADRVDRAARRSPSPRPSTAKLVPMITVKARPRSGSGAPRWTSSDVARRSRSRCRSPRRPRASARPRSFGAIAATRDRRRAIRRDRGRVHARRSRAARASGARTAPPIDGADAARRPQQPVAEVAGVERLLREHDLRHVDERDRDHRRGSRRRARRAAAGNGGRAGSPSPRSRQCPRRSRLGPAGAARRGMPAAAARPRRRS